MKTTVRTPNGRATVAPLAIAGELSLALLTYKGETAQITLTPDQVGALIFGMEAALELLDIQRANYGAAA